MIRLVRNDSSSSVENDSKLRNEPQAVRAHLFAHRYARGKKRETKKDRGQTFSTPNLLNLECATLSDVPIWISQVDSCALKVADKFHNLETDTKEHEATEELRLAALELGAGETEKSGASDNRLAPKKPDGEGGPGSGQLRLRVVDEEFEYFRSIVDDAMATH